MRHLVVPTLLAFALLLPTATARAQADGGTPDAGGADGGTAASAAPAPEDGLQASAYLFFQGLAAGVPDAVAEMVAYPFDLDGETLKSRRELVRRLKELYQRHDLSHLTFYGIEAFPADRMIARFGPPPERLGTLDLEGAWVAVANLGGHGYVAVFRKRGERWVAVAYTD